MKLPNSAFRKTCITVPLEEETYVPQLLTTEGWLRTNEEGEIDLEFGDEGLTSINISLYL